MSHQKLRCAVRTAQILIIEITVVADLPGLEFAVAADIGLTISSACVFIDIIPVIALFTSLPSVSITTK